MSTYDSASYYSRKQLILNGGGQGLVVTGTQAIAGDLMRVVLTDDVTVDKMAVVANIGGTAAGPVVVLNTSRAGTGALNPIGTFKIGTTADGTNLGAIAVASTTLTAGDQLVLQVAAGTAAASPKFSVCIGYKQTVE